MTRTKAQKSTPSTRAFSKFERRQRYRKPNIHSGRTNMHWKSTAFLYVDDGELFVRDEDVDYINITDTSSNTRHHINTITMKVSLLDIARPAKQKGAAKDFEIVQKVRNIIALEDEFDSESLLEYQWEDDDEWEQIYDEQLHPTEKRSYSSVLKGLNETRT